MAQNNAYKVDSGDVISDENSTSVSHGKLYIKRTSCKQICCMQLFAVVVFALGITGGIFIGIYAYHDAKTDEPVTVNCQSNGNHPPGVNTQTSMPPEVKPAETAHQKPGECSKRDPVLDNRYENYIFSPLTASEMYKAAEFLKKRNLISTLEQPSNLTQNFILYQCIHPPMKADALKYLDQNGPKPKRYAKVTVQRGGVASPDVMEYKVGPLDSDTMTVEELTKPGEIHFNSRPYEFLELNAVEDLLRPHIETLAPLISESFDGAKYPDDVYIDMYNGPPSTSGTDRVIRFVFTNNQNATIKICSHNMFLTNIIAEYFRSIFVNYTCCFQNVLQNEE